LEAVLALRVTRGHYGWCYSIKGKISYIFFSRDHVPISHRFDCRKRPLKIQKRASDRSSTAIAEPSGDNRVKIRPLKVDIIGLTKIAKKRNVKKEI